MSHRSWPTCQVLLAFAVQRALASGVTLEEGLHRPAAWSIQQTCDDAAFLQLKVRSDISPPELFNPNAPPSQRQLPLKELKRKVASKPMGIHPALTALATTVGDLTAPTLTYLTVTPGPSAAFAVPPQAPKLSSGPSAAFAVPPEAPQVTPGPSAALAVLPQAPKTDKPNRTKVDKPNRTKVEYNGAKLLPTVRMLALGGAIAGTVTSVFSGVVGLAASVFWASQVATSFTADLIDGVLK
eukprot:gnl/TRDRNA2_/TRDRNA2_80300_c0_seq1.p2 gnl/TRDRNA2_/TRDRNA2_80300_c0~~gnl/TRDRNA2_/TRDRNA2_80300_c0_seq1.p2  ORF type:complete len:240 (-),score=17.76 gnl/TRDRNA2_/TRDRNA2_80300_c0_seq1:274-993(-)